MTKWRVNASGHWYNLNLPLASRIALAYVLVALALALIAGRVFLMESLRRAPSARA